MCHTDFATSFSYLPSSGSRERQGFLRERSPDTSDLPLRQQQHCDGFDDWVSRRESINNCKVTGDHLPLQQITDFVN